jgi:DNA polymerase-1
MSTLIALIDSDIVAYRCAASSEAEPEEIALLRTEGMMKEILEGSTSFVCYLTGPNNFRYKINPEYKANRKDKPKPIHLPICREYLIDQYNAVVTDGYEADDALGMAQTNDSVIFSIDKDLLMIPGCHFNFVTKTYKEVDELEGLKAFYRSMLIGDTSDNIRGVDGIGKVKAGRLIDPCTTESQMFDIVYKLYNDEVRFLMNADCLYIWRNLDEKFTDRMDRGKEEIFYNISPSCGEQEMAPEVPVS